MSYSFSKRYAIRISEGLYSDGPKMRKVPLNKAKLWTNIGHVKNHIQRVNAKYPPGATVVEVIIESREEDLCPVAILLEEHENRAQKQHDMAMVASAHRELEEAKRLLSAARAKVKKYRCHGENDPPRQTDVHTEHCCVEHGCKYGSDSCTVVALGVKQSFPCEACDYEDEED